MPTNTPVKEVEALKQQSLTNDQIIKDLQGKGFSSQQIYDALNQTDVKMGVNQPTEDEMSEAPSPYSDDMSSMQPSLMDDSATQPADISQMDMPSEPEIPSPQESYSPVQPQQNYQQQQQFSNQDIEETVELIISEKWSQLIEKIGDFQVWKEKNRMEVEAIKQEVLRLRTNFENLQNSLISKVNEYNKNNTNVTSEMQAMEKVFEKILEPMTANIKELSRITEAMKKK